jgi:hypothetical protein
LAAEPNMGWRFRRSILGSAANRCFDEAEEDKSARFFRVNEVAEVNKRLFSSKLVVNRMFSYKL